MRTLKLNKLHPKYWLLARKNRKIQHQTEYNRVLKDCDGDVGTTELIMSLMKIDPRYNREALLPDERPEFILVKKLRSS